MKIKIYVDWENREVYDEKAKEIEIQRRAEAMNDDDYALEGFLDDYCNRNLGRCERAELFKMSEEKRAEVLAEFGEECVTCAKDEFIEETEEFELEV
jgi:hypothetical protein